VQFKTGGIHHPRLNRDGKPIANKYRKGKMKRTLKRESKELEAVENEAIIALMKTSGSTHVPYSAPRLSVKLVGSKKASSLAA